MISNQTDSKNLELCESCKKEGNAYIKFYKRAYELRRIFKAV